MYPRHLRLGAKVVLVALATAVVLLARAMHLYPGGNCIDRHASHHSFWLNFLCDLTGDRSLDAAENPGFGSARAAIVSLAVALAAFWLIFPALLPDARAVGPLIRIAGVPSAIGLMAVPWAEGALHTIAIYATLGPGLMATVLSLVAIARGSREVILLLATSCAIAAGGIDAALYARRVMDHFQTCPPALPALQRVAALLMVAWMGTVAYRVLRKR